MELLDKVYYGNTVQQWLIAAGIAIAVAIALRLFKAVVLRQLGKLTDKTQTSLDDIFVRTLDHTRWFFYVGLGLYLGSLYLEIDEAVEHGIDVAASIVFFLQLGIWLQNGVRLSVDRYRQKHEETPSSGTMAAAIGFLARLAIWSVVLLLVLSNLGIEISALIAGLGVGGVAAALALQTVLGDLFASLSIYFDRPFDIGDFIIVDDFMGNVERIGMRSTRVKSLGGEQLVFANSDLASARIRNYRRMQERRIAFHVGIEYNLPYEKVAKVPELLKEAVEATDNVRFDRAHFKSYGDFSLVYETVYYVLSADYAEYMERQQSINLGVYKRFEDNGIPFAFPTRTLHLRSDEPVTVQQSNGAAAD